MPRDPEADNMKSDPTSNPLRSPVAFLERDKLETLCLRLQDAVERLSAELGDAKALISSLRPYQGEVDRLSAELSESRALVRRLGEALEQLAELGEVGMRPDPNEWLTFHDKVAQIAHEALKGKTV